MDANAQLWYNDLNEGVSVLAYTKAGMKAVDRYVKENYDRLNVKVPKGRKATVEALAAERGQSVNGLINELLRAAAGLTEEEWKGKE